MGNKTYNEQMLDIREMYLATGKSEPIDLEDLAKFAISNGHWTRGESQIIQFCKRDFSRAFREQYHTDEQGREVRTYHAVKVSQGEQQSVLWADLRNADHEHMEKAFSQRRRLILGECLQLKNDVDSYNENVSHGPAIQLLLNFEVDVAERSQPVTFE